MNSSDDFEKHSDDLIARLNDGKPIEMSDEVRALAEQVIAYQATQQNLSEEEMVAWAKALVASMYGKDVDSTGGMKLPFELDYWRSYE
jgi:hypothetical protein